jgi:hypothetical protein
MILKLFLILLLVLMVSVPAFNLTFPATASTILSVLLPDDTVDYLGILSSPHAQAELVGKISLYNC